jgi:hypothetical protein
LGWRGRLLVLAAVLVGLGLHLWAARHWPGNFTSDEAVMGLMARHALAGRIPVYMYGQGYLGSIDALLGAAAMSVLGATVVTLRLPAILLFGAWLGLFAVLVRRWFGDGAAAVSALVVAVSSLWMTAPALPVVPVGAMSIAGTLALLLAISSGARRAAIWRWLAVGACAGLAFWLYPIAVQYFPPLVLVVLLRSAWWARAHRRLAAAVRRRLHLPVEAVLGFVGLSLLALVVLVFFFGAWRPAFFARRDVQTAALMGGGLVLLAALVGGGFAAMLAAWRPRWKRSARPLVAGLALTVVVLVAAALARGTFAGRDVVSSLVMLVTMLPALGPAWSGVWLMGVLGLGAAALAVIYRRRATTQALLAAALGALVGSSPAWAGRLFLGVATVWPIRPSSAVDVPLQIRFLFERLLPNVWGTPWLSDFGRLSTFEAVRWGLIVALWAGTMVWFVWSRRGVVRALVALSPLRADQAAPAIILLLVALPVFLAAASGNVLNMWYPRYMTVAWQASAVMLALFIVHLARSWRVVAAGILLLWLAQAGIGNLTAAHRRWHAEYCFAPADVAAVEAFLEREGVSGGYAVYWS